MLLGFGQLQINRSLVLRGAQLPHLLRAQSMGSLPNGYIKFSYLFKNSFKVDNKMVFIDLRKNSNFIMLKIKVKDFGLITQPPNSFIKVTGSGISALLTEMKKTWDIHKNIRQDEYETGLRELKPSKDGLKTIVKFDDVIFKSQIKIEYIIYYIDVRINERGKYLRLAQTQVGAEKAVIIIPQKGVNEFFSVIERARIAYRENEALHPSLSSSGQSSNNNVVPSKAKTISKRSKNTIFVSGLPSYISKIDLITFFSTVGSIATASLFDQSHLSFVSGTVEFEKEQDAAEAVKIFNNTKFKERIIIVRFHEN